MKNFLAAVFRVESSIGKSCIEPARTVRVRQTASNAFRYDECRRYGLPPRIANAYVRFADNAKLVAQQRCL